MNYLEFFGLQSEPFSDGVSVRGYYKSVVHGSALLKVMSAIDEAKPGVLVTGTRGVGKSLLLQLVLDHLSDEGMHAAFVSLGQPLGEEATLVNLVALQMQLGHATSLADVDAACAQLRARDDRTTILIDDAHLLAPELLRALGAMEHATVILVGAEGADYPELDSLVLKPLSESATLAYLRARLKAAGGQRHLFSAETGGNLHRLTGGVPALINRVGKQSLVSAMLAGLDQVSAEVVEQAEPALIAWSALTAASGQVGEPYSPQPASGPEETSSPAGEDDEALNEADDEEGDGLNSLLDELEAEERATDETSPVKATEDDPVEEDADEDAFDDFEAEETEERGEAEPEAAFAAEEAASELSEQGPDLGIDDSFAEAEAPAESAPADSDDEFDDMFDALDDEVAADTGSAGSDADAAGDDDSDLDDLLAGLADDDADDAADDFSEPASEPQVEPEPQPAAALSADDDQDDDFDNLLDDLVVGDDEEAADEGEYKVEAKSEADLDSMLDQLGGGDFEDSSGTVDNSDSDDLDDLLNGLDDDEENAASAKSEEDDLDDLLSGFDSDDVESSGSAEAVTGHDDLLIGDPGDSSSDDDDLDALLSGLDDEEEASPAPAASKERQPVGADDLENELDSLLDGLDD